MEKNNDYNRETSDYEPNFILKDPEDPGAAEDKADRSMKRGIGAEGPQAKETRVIRPATEEEKEALRAAIRAEEANPTSGPAAASAGRESRQAQQPRPRFENPDFNKGETMGTYRDPRGSFRQGERASWSNGELKGGGRKKKEPSAVTMSRKAMVFLICGCLLLSGLFGFGGVALGHHMFADSPTGTTPTAQTVTGSSKGDGKTGTTETTGYSLENATGSNMTVKEITAVAQNSVVEIRTEQVTSDSWMQEYVTEGAGSGVIISKDGYVMTNNHVISGANKIKVTTKDEKEYEAELIGADENNDVAVLKIDASGLTPAVYGNSDQLEVGDLAVAIGNPLGELGGTVTAGIISAKDRELSIDGKTLHLLQTDSSINPGNSGGGLFNGDGQLIGLVVAKSAGSDVEGLGFAIPVNTAANVAQQLMDKGYVSGQPSTGMTYQEVSGSGSDGSFESIFGGSGKKMVQIYSVNGETAKKAGFQSGDIVLAVDDQEITSFQELSAVVTAHKVGDELTFKIERNGGEKNIKLKLEEKKAETTTNKDEENAQDGEDTPGSQEQDPFGGDEDLLPEIPGEDGNGGGSLFDYFFGW